MQRRRLLGLLGAAGLSSTTGCLDGLVDSVEFIDRPGEVGGEWTPSLTSDPAEQLVTHRENAEAIAYLQLTMADCEGSDDSLDTTELVPRESDDNPPPIEVATATEQPASGPFTQFLTTCTPIASDHEPYLEQPTGLVDDTHFEYAYLLTLRTTSPLTLDVDFAGTLPGNLAYIEVTVSPGEATTAAIVRVGAWADPEGILVGITADGTEVASGVYESGLENH